MPIASGLGLRARPIEDQRVLENCPPRSLVSRNPFAWLYDECGGGSLSRLGQPAIYWQLANGSGAAERLTETARAPESFSAQNQMLSFITLNANGGGADYDVWTYSFRDKKSAPLIQIKSSAQHSSRFSPDGKWIAYVSDETGRLELYVQPFPTTGARFQITKNGGGHPLWSPDGKELYFDNSGRMFSVAIQAQPGFSAGEPAPLPIRGFVQGQGNVRRQYDMISDGKQFIMMFASP
jgi:Tol biopolymer transport system component